MTIPCLDFERQGDGGGGSGGACDPSCLAGSRIGRASKFRGHLGRLPRMNTMSRSLTVSAPPTHNERILAAIAHGGTWFAWFLAPLVVYLLERDCSSFASRHAAQALVWSAIGTLVSAATCGLALPVFLGIHLYAAVRALEGREFDYPFVGAILEPQARVSA